MAAGRLINLPAASGENRAFKNHSQKKDNIIQCH